MVFNSLTQRGHAMNPAGHNILVVDDEEPILRMLRTTLDAVGYHTATAMTGEEALSTLRAKPFDVMLLDLVLPDIDGKDVITRARAFYGAPIVVLSVRTAEEEKIEALDRGANDYVSKPFAMGELLARLRVAVRPAAGGSPSLAQGLQFDFKSRTVLVEGMSRRLTVRESEMLRVLVAANGEIVSHKDLIRGVWGPASDANLMHLRVLAWHVRRKIEADASQRRYLLAEPGLGYRLNLGGES